MNSFPPPPKPSMRERYNALLSEWGPLLVVVYFSIFAIVLVGFATAIKLGFRPDSATGTAGTWGAAWLATKLTQPLRIAATLFITPALGTLMRRIRRQPDPGEPAAAPSALEETPSGER